MIRFLLLQNRAGRTRLSKYYVPIEEKERRKLEYEIHRRVSITRLGQPAADRLDP